MVEIDITPQPKPRMTRKDKWNPSDAAKRYFQYKRDVTILLRKAGVRPCDVIDVTFVMPIAARNMKSFSEIDGAPHRQAPDLDNLIKGYLDILFPPKSMGEDDRVVHSIKANKVWGATGKIIIH